MAWSAAGHAAALLLLQRAYDPVDHPEHLRHGGHHHLSSMHGSAISPARIWAVGSTGAIVLYDGSTGLWSTHAQSGTNTGGLTTSFLSKVYTVNSTSAWISSSSNVVYRYDGTNWVTQTAADPHRHHCHLGQQCHRRLGGQQRRHGAALSAVTAAASGG